jgi:hypothetical protein
LPPSSFTESDLHFEFPSHWGVRVYDDHRFYKSMSGLGLKGVDFLLIDPSGAGHLYLIEVKNYRTRIREEGSYVAKLKPAAELAATVAAKYKHTQRALRAVQLYYRRKWWYRLLEGQFKKSRYLHYDLVFWTRAYALANDPERHTLLLWLETEQDEEAYKADLENKLVNILAKRVKVKVSDEYWK